MKVTLLTLTALLILGGTAQATPDKVRYSDLERVDRIHFVGSIDGWRAIDRDSLIIWATPFKPYLVELSRKSFDLRFANVIGVTSTAGSVREKFDSIVVDGLRYPIEAIYKLDRETAKSMKRAS